VNLIISIFAFLSTALAIYSTVPYIQAILKKKTKPHQLSWLIFVIMNGIVFFSQFLAGGRASILITLAFFAGSLAIFILSLKFGVRDSSRWDKLLFFFALSTIIIWVLTKSNALAIWLTVLIDIFATSMTILKIKADANSEAPFPWIIATIAYIFTCLTLIGQSMNILYVRPLYGLIGDFAIVAFIYYWRTRMRTK
jgi:hypothetical protein